MLHNSLNFANFYIIKIYKNIDFRPFFTYLIKGFTFIIVCFITEDLKESNKI